MDKTRTSPSRENYEELEGLTPEEIEKRVVYGEIMPIEDAVKCINKLLLEQFNE